MMKLDSITLSAGVTDGTPSRTSVMYGCRPHELKGPLVRMGSRSGSAGWDPDPSQPGGIQIRLSRVGSGSVSAGWDPDPAQPGGIQPGREHHMGDRRAAQATATTCAHHTPVCPMALLGLRVGGSGDLRRRALTDRPSRGKSSAADCARSGWLRRTDR